MATQLPFQVGQRVGVVGGRVEARATKPPPRYTDASLLDDMVGVHKFVVSEPQRSMLMKTKGLGTERTRPDVIEKNVNDGLFIRVGKFIDASPLAIEIDSYIDEGLKDPARTGLLEAALQNVADGKTSAEAFMAGAERYAQQIVDKALSTNFDGVQVQAQREKSGFDQKQSVEPLPGHGESCSKCGQGKMETRYSTKTSKRFLGCNAFPKCKHIQS